MKKILWFIIGLTLLLSLWLCGQSFTFSDVSFVAQGATSSGSPAEPTWHIDEDFEGSDVESGWTNSTGTPDWDYGTALEGSQSIMMDTIASGAAIQATTGFSQDAGATLECRFLFKCETNSLNNTRIICSFRTGTSARGAVSVRGTAYSNVLRAQAAGGTAVDTVSGLSVGTTYYIWVTYKLGTGANATVTVGFSASDSRPTSGNSYAESTDGTGTADANNVLIGSDGSAVRLVFDDFKLCDETIP